MKVKANVTYLHVGNLLFRLRQPDWIVVAPGTAQPLDQSTFSIMGVWRIDVLIGYNGRPMDDEIYEKNVEFEDATQCTEGVVRNVTQCLR